MKTTKLSDLSLEELVKEEKNDQVYIFPIVF